MSTKKLILLAAFITPLFVQAKDYVLVVKSDVRHTKGHTEVTSNGDGTADTLTVTPGSDATTIVATVEDANGNLLDQQVVSVGTTSTLNLSVPADGSGSLLRIRDDNGVVYEEEN